MNGWHEVRIRVSNVMVIWQRAGSKRALAWQRVRGPNHQASSIERQSYQAH
jgi:hypothetical protein